LCHHSCRIMKSDINASLADDAFLFKVQLFTFCWEKPDENTKSRLRHYELLVTNIAQVSDRYCRTAWQIWTVRRRVRLC